MSTLKIAQCLGVASAAALGLAMMPVALVHADESAVDAWKRDAGTFTIGVALDASSPRTSAQYGRFRQVVAESLGMPVEVFVASSMPALIDAHASGRVDYSVQSGLGYWTTQALCGCVEPLVAPSTGEGATAIRSTLIADETVVPDTAALSDVQIALGPAGNLTATIIPKAHFRFDGLAFGESQLDTVHFASMEQAMDAIAEGEVAAMFGWEHALPETARRFDDTMLARLDMRVGAEPEPHFGVLWRSDAYRFGPHMVSDGVPDPVKRQLRAMMLDLHADAPLAFDEISGPYAGPFLAVSAFDYRAYALLLDSALER